ncbi:glycerophosphodiester phosphodiesterase family protein [Propioniciclava soli]|uniref:glycerophosphodiester phosphodiesterase family protein n=1 Tax=Propioniciclava soli TaxID=2775081 RepID=UPI001E618F75
MFGHATHAQVNGLVNSLAGAGRPLVVSHAGVAVGPFPSNTTAAVRCALQSGADGVKIDVSASVDHIFYAFHDGFEDELLGEERNIQSLTAAEIAQLSYRWKNRPGHRAQVERLASLLGEFRGKPVIFALDRSWWRWPTLLRVLDGLQMADQLLLKVPGWETSALGALRQHRTRYPVLAICSTPEELAALPLGDEAVNLVGVELIAHDADHPWFDPDVLDSIHRDDLLVWINSETLTTGVPLFGGFDDEKAVLESPTAAWSHLLDLGVDAVQTELPWLLRELREARHR